MTVLSIVGATGSGKTAYAFHLAERLITMRHCRRVILVSADSRQVYKGLEVVSGADVPATMIRVEASVSESLPYSHFIHESLPIELHAVGIVEPDVRWSLAAFRQLVQAVEASAQSDTALFIVGGTGLYHRWIYQRAPWQDVPPDPELRARLSTSSVGELQEHLIRISAPWLQRMNNSDRNNPRRLIRAIERATANFPASQYQTGVQSVQPLIAILDDPATRELRIRHRVHERISNGAILEVEQLKSKYCDQILPVWSTLGVPQIAQYLDGTYTYEKMLESWITAELSYVKRQMTWLAQEKVCWLEPNAEEVPDFLLRTKTL